MSGTSVDGVDVALVDFSNNGCRLLDYYLHPIEKNIQQKIAQFYSFEQANKLKNPVDELMQLDSAMGKIFADAVNYFLRSKKIHKSLITAIGSHGQTIRHDANGKFPYSLQVGDPNTIAYQTGITTVADFRRMDIAAGGQGAPLAPAFHAEFMRSSKQDRVILNLGGIANITLLPKDQQREIIGFDTGPANTLLDAHFKKIHPEHADGFDREGAFARQGKVNQQLLASLLSDTYFQLPPPKSTGREYFCLNWLDSHLQQFDQKLAAASLQATLLQLSVTSIVDAINRLGLDELQIYVCGGGMHNQFLLDKLSKQLNSNILTTNDLGIDGDYLEAMTFAWLAQQRLLKQAIDLKSITGAKHAQILGGIYRA